MDAKSAAAAVGRQGTIFIGQAWVSFQPTVNGQPTFINDAPFPNHTFTALIWGRSRPAFSPAPEQTFSRRALCVTGPVTSFQGKPQIEVQNPAQIRVIP